MVILIINPLIKNKTTIILWEITTINASLITFPIIFDPAGIIFRAVVLFISANVLLFSNTYIDKDPFINRFTLLVFAFVLSINILIFLPHLIILLLGWDGLGLISFLLVIYYQNSKSLAAGLITALTNRIGDAFLLIAIALTANQNHWNITNIWNHPIINILTFSILIAGMTKSAQIPFSRWLPAAIAAPTPVSALVHSSTLVTAGVFLLIRFYPILHSTKWFNSTLLIVASLTILIAGLRAIYEYDLKKIIALSTLSQLGVIIAALGIGYVSLALFHLLTHALFKALLFLCAGNIIHTHLHAQDLRTVGNLTNQLPLTSSCILIANISLCGAPFLAGFYSKDAILELSLWAPLNFLILLIIFIATALTATYSTRFFLHIALSPNYHPSIININEEDRCSTFPIKALSLGAILAGSIIFWALSPLTISPQLPAPIKIFTLSIILLIIFITFLIVIDIVKIRRKPSLNLTAHTFIWFLTPLSSQILIKPSIILRHYFLKIIDQTWTERRVSQASHLTLKSTSNKLQYLQKNSINIYILTSLLAFPLI